MKRQGHPQISTDFRRRRVSLICVNLENWKVLNGLWYQRFFARQVTFQESARGDAFSDLGLEYGDSAADALLVDYWKQSQSASIQCPPAIRQINRVDALIRLAVSLVTLLFLFALYPRASRAEEPKPAAVRTTILAHYLPWFEAKPHSPSWGWHWTMNAFDPERTAGGKRQIASQYYPLIGPYDSGDPHVLEYHLLLMKLAGIDGVIVDWYGRADFRDYAIVHRNTQLLFDQAGRLGMSFAVCYEDQTIPLLVEAGRIAEADRVQHAADEIDWLARHWFPLKGYVKLDGRPILLSFGQGGLREEEWTQCLGLSRSPAAYFSEHHRRSSAVGAFDWPVPQEGIAAIERFEKESRTWARAIPAAYPRFVDIYAEAKVHESWGRIDDQNGITFRTTLEKGLKSGNPLVQIATWNDWGEGTMVEPSVEFGFRDLECVQELRKRHLEPAFAPTADDLKLVHRLLQVRRSKPASSRRTEQADVISSQLATGLIQKARSAIEALERSE